VKAKIVAANGLDLRLFRTLPDYSRAARQTERHTGGHGSCRRLKGRAGQAMGGLRGMRLGMLEGNTDEGYISVGAGIGNIHAITSVAEVVNQLAV
jgi:enoyl-[acyl-carrier protein] reductase II